MARRSGDSIPDRNGLAAAAADYRFFNVFDLPLEARSTVAACRGRASGVQHVTAAAESAPAFFNCKTLQVTRWSKVDAALFIQ